MPATTRTFIAVELPRERIDQLVRLRGELAPSIAGARWVEPPNLHLTLAFLGDVPDSDLAGLCRAVEAAVAPHARLDLRVEGLGAFPDPKRPRVVWAGLAGPDLPRLAELQGAVAAAAREAGYPPDDRFHPHVTLARLKPGRGPSPDLTPLLDRRARWSAGPMPVAEVVTFASTPTPEGPAYAPLSRARLKPRKAAGPT